MIYRGKKLYSITKKMLFLIRIDLLPFDSVLNSKTTFLPLQSEKNTSDKSTCPLVQILAALAELRGGCHTE